MSADIQRLQQLRERAQSARCDDHTTMSDTEVDELIALERLHAAEQAGIRATRWSCSCASSPSAWRP